MTKQSILQPAVYMVVNRKRGAIYTGVTSNLVQRIYQHKEGIFEGFSKKYGCKSLVFFEMYENMESAILREKQIKAGSRKAKIDLIENANKDWKDIYSEIL